VGQVANTKTPLSNGQALGVLLAAGCPQSAVLMVAAQSAVETAGWKSMVQWNMGNVTPSAAQIAAGISWMTQGVPNMRFIAYPDAVSGARGMLGWLQGHGLLPYAEANDLVGYTARLAAGCYLGCIGSTDPSNGQTITQANYNSYAGGIASWMQKLQNVQPLAPPGAPWSFPTTKRVLLVVGIVGAAAALAYAARQARVRRYLHLPA
jgi:hypothetical protein